MFVGIDVVINYLVANVMDNHKKDVFHSYLVDNNSLDCLKLINLIADNASLLKLDIIKIGMKATNVF